MAVSYVVSVQESFQILALRLQLQ